MITAVLESIMRKLKGNGRHNENWGGHDERVRGRRVPLQKNQRAPVFIFATIKWSKKI